MAGNEQPRCPFNTLEAGIFKQLLCCFLMRYQITNYTFLSLPAKQYSQTPAQSSARLWEKLISKFLSILCFSLSLDSSTRVFGRLRTTQVNFNQTGKQRCLALTKQDNTQNWPELKGPSDMDRTQADLLTFLLLLTQASHASYKRNFNILKKSSRSEGMCAIRLFSDAKASNLWRFKKGKKSAIMNLHCIVLSSWLLQASFGSADIENC